MTDHDPKDNSLTDRSPTVRGFRWLFSWPGVRRLLIIAAWIVSLIALVYGVENWRGWRAWSTYRDQLLARGESLSFQAFVPKPVPADQNFAATPFIQSWFEPNTNSEPKEVYPDNYAAAARLVHGPGKAQASQRHFLDLVAYRQAFEAARAPASDPEPRFDAADRTAEERANAAPKILEELSPSAPLFAELLTASRRPLAIYPVKYQAELPWAILLPHLARVKASCQRLQLKAAAELAMGQTAEAVRDVRLILHLADSLREEPILVSHLVRVACWHLALQVVWEGLAEQRWSEPQLRQLQSRLLEPRFLADLQLPLRAERGAALDTVEYVRKTGRLSLLSVSATEPRDGVSPADYAARLAPRGWYYWEQRNYCELMDTYFRGAYQPAELRLSPSQLNANSLDVMQAINPPDAHPLSRIFRHKVAAAMLLPALSKIYVRTSTAQVASQQAALACALERARLAHGRFPAQLQDLVPAYLPALPKDVLTGKDYQYRVADGSPFQLYSLGWNEKDDQGKPGETLFDDKQGDWVWTYAK